MPTLVKTRVSFVELTDTTLVPGPASEVHEQILWEDFLAVCDVKERHVVVCLRDGRTRVGDIARELGYANHSPVSKGSREFAGCLTCQFLILVLRGMRLFPPS